MRKILITGANGQLGTALQQHPTALQYRLTPLTHQALDITDFDAVNLTLKQHRPDILINTAAYTAVDKAESDQARCDQINYLGASHLAIACEANNIPLIHLSTDYVFDGHTAKPYNEDDTTNPINYYGASKLRGEEAIKKHCKNHIILRVSGIFSTHGLNFLNTMIRLGKERKELTIVSDQITCPTYAFDIADAIYAISEQLTHYGIYHYCSTPPTSWHEFATTIIDYAKIRQPLIVETIRAITTAQYPTPAARPAVTVLNCSKIKRDYSILQPSWQTALSTIFKGN